jgi:ribosomal protein L32E
MPNAGYGTNKKDRHVLKTGFRKVVVNNVSDLELLMMHNRWVGVLGRGGGRGAGKKAIVNGVPGLLLMDS